MSIPNSTAYGYLPPIQYLDITPPPQAEEESLEAQLTRLFVERTDMPHDDIPKPFSKKVIMQEVEFILDQLQDTQDTCQHNLKVHHLRMARAKESIRFLQHETRRLADCANVARNALVTLVAILQSMKLESVIPEDVMQTLMLSPSQMPAANEESKIDDDNNVVKPEPPP